jgi:ammonia channel protein AmtB
LGRFDSALALKIGVASIFGVLVVAVVIGEVTIVVAAFAALVLSLRVQRRQEAKRLHGYRRKRRRRT